MGFDPGAHPPGAIPRTVGTGVGAAADLEGQRFDQTARLNGVRSRSPPNQEIGHRQDLLRAGVLVA